MGGAALVRQSFPSREQGEGSCRKADEVMEKVQVVEEAFRRLVRPGHDQPRSIPQCARLRMQERSESKPSGGAVQARETRTPSVAGQCGCDRRKPLRCWWNGCGVRHCLCGL
jgi:hypothetical protein